MKSLVLNACNYVLAFLPKLVLFAINTCERHYTTFVSPLYIYLSYLAGTSKISCLIR